MIETVYKLVRVLPQSQARFFMRSVNCSPIGKGSAAGVTLAYRLHTRRKPIIPRSLLFAFDTQEHANRFAREEFFTNDSWAILRCEADVVAVNPWRISLWGASRAQIEEFWTSPRDGLSCPRGTVVCRYILPLEIVDIHRGDWKIFGG